METFFYDTLWIEPFRIRVVLSYRAILGHRVAVGGSNLRQIIDRSGGRIISENVIIVEAVSRPVPSCVESSARICGLGC